MKRGVRLNNRLMSEINGNIEKNTIVVPINESYLIKRAKFIWRFCISLSLLLFLFMQLRHPDLLVNILSITPLLIIVPIAMIYFKKTTKSWCIIFTEDGLILNHGQFSNGLEIAKNEFLIVKKDMRNKNWILMNSNRPKIKAKILVAAYPNLLETVQNEFKYILPS